MMPPLYTPFRRSVVIHEDDVGMTHGANIAFRELSALGICSSGAVMVPCPWFPEAAEMALNNSTLDVGVHLTLNSEQQPYRWRPVSRPSPAAGLTDDCGYLWSTLAELLDNATPEAVEEELRAQVDIALAAGIDVTHLDCHMGAARLPDFVDRYFRIGEDYNLPILLVEGGSPPNPRNYDGPLPPGPCEAVLDKARAKGLPIFSRSIETPWSRTADAETAYHEIFRSISDGMTFLALHFNAPGDFESIEPDFSHIRTEEYALFKSGIIQEWAKAYGFNIVGMRNIRDTLRSHLRTGQLE